jgi:hypothetical protein
MLRFEEGRRIFLSRKPSGRRPAKLWTRPSLDGGLRKKQRWDSHPQSDDRLFGLRSRMSSPDSSLFQWFSRATLGAMPLWLLRYKFICSQEECGYHNALDAVAQADTPKTAASQVGKSQHLCGRCGRPLTDSSSLKMAVPVPISSVEKKRPVSESGKQPSQDRGTR